MKHRIFRIHAVAWMLALGAPHPAAEAAAPKPLAASTLAASSSTTTVSGSLATGKTPLANATLSATAIDVNARGGLSWRQFTGTVPAGAVAAVLALRAGTEGATISAGGGASFGGIWYVEPTTGVWADISPVILPVSGAPDSVQTAALVPGKPIAANFGGVWVTPNAPYAVYVAIAATGSAATAGYIGVIFLNAKGAEIKRDRIWLTSAQIDLGTVTTNAAGQFQLSVPATVAAVYPQIQIGYAGSSTVQASTVVIPSTATAAQAAMPALAQQLPGSAQLNGKTMGWFTPREDFLGMLVTGKTWDQLLPQWSNAAPHIQAIRLPTTVLMNIPDATLQSMVQAMDAHGMAFALEIGSTNWYNEAACGAGVESYSDPGTANAAVQKLMNAGAKLSAILLDEPLYFGHYYTGANACQSSIADLARRNAVIVRVFTAAFPNVTIADIEPFPVLSMQPNWAADYATWLQAFYAQSGSTISILHMDFDWDQPSLYQYLIYPSSTAIAGLAQQIAPVARAYGLKLGMIMNGSASSTSDAAWVQTAQFHIDAIMASGIAPDQVLFETWSTPPSKTIPETDPTSLSSLIDYFYAKYK